MLNKAPTKYTLRGLALYVEGRNVELTDIGDGVNTPGGTWVPARPIGYFSLRRRIRYAWMVFTGKADIFTWPGDQ